MESQIVTKEEKVPAVQASPAEMIQQAVKSGASLVELKGLLELQKEWEANEARKAFHLSMAAFKSNPPRISKNKKVSFNQTNYKYADLSNVTETINTELSKHGLTASWITQTNGVISVTCRITHVLGHSEETTMSAEADKSGAKNNIQAIGSTVSYLQRYTLLAICGLATSDQDDDAHGASELISEKQLHDLRDALIAKDLPEKGLTDFLKIEKLENLKASEYHKAMNTIKATKKPEVKK